MSKGRAEEALRLLGLARRAGSVAPGTDAARRAVRSGEARLVLLAGDASSVQLDKVRNVLRNRPIPWGTLGDRTTLGAALGRGPTSAVAITADSFAGAMGRLVDLVEGAAPETSEEER